MMPIFASDTASIVRQRPAWLPSRLAYLAVFIVVAVVFAWKSLNSRPPKIEMPPIVAKICIHKADFPYEDAWREILAQTNGGVRENVSVEAKSSGGETIVAISSRGPTANSALPVVNLVAAAYVQACRVQWKLHVEQAYSAAGEKLRQLQRQASEAETRCELLSVRRLQALASTRPVPVPPAEIENPRWTEASRRLADLQQRKRTLLLERTPEHPAVQEIGLRIADQQREMASISPSIPQEPQATATPPAAPVAMPPVAEIQEAQKAAEQLKQEFELAQRGARSAFAAREQQIQIDYIPAEEPPCPAPTPRDNNALVGKALVAAGTATIGLGMISHGASLEPVLSSIAELPTLLSVPVVGVIPAAHAGRRLRMSAMGRRIARWGWAAAGLAVLLAVAWLFLHG
jgi:hypothetical protein